MRSPSSPFVLDSCRSSFSTGRGLYHGARLTSVAPFPRADENIYTLDYLLEQRSSSATLQNKSTGGHREADRINVLAQEAFAAGVSLPATTNGQGNSSRKRANKKAKPRPSSDQDELANSNVAAAGGAREVNAAVGDDVSSDTVMPDNNDGGVEEEGPDEDDDTWMGIAD